MLTPRDRIKLTAAYDDDLAVAHQWITEHAQDGDEDELSKLGVAIAEMRNRDDIPESLEILCDMAMLGLRHAMLTYTD